MRLPRASIDVFSRVTSYQQLSDHVLSEYSQKSITKWSFSCCIEWKSHQVCQTIIKLKQAKTSLKNGVFVLIY